MERAFAPTLTGPIGTPTSCLKVRVLCSRQVNPGDARRASRWRPSGRVCKAAGAGRGWSGWVRRPKPGRRKRELPRGLALTLPGWAARALPRGASEPPKGAGVCPSLSTYFTSQPALMSSSSAAAWPCLAAKWCAGVRPSLSAAFTSQPALMSSSSATAWPRMFCPRNPPHYSRRTVCP